MTDKDASRNKGRQEKCLKSCRQCQAENETCSHMVGNCPIVQDTKIKRPSYICEMLSKEAEKQDWTVLQEPHIRDDSNELYKPVIQTYCEENPNIHGGCECVIQVY